MHFEVQQRGYGVEELEVRIEPLAAGASSISSAVPSGVEHHVEAMLELVGRQLVRPVDPERPGVLGHVRGALLLSYAQTAEPVGLTDLEEDALGVDLLDGAEVGREGVVNIGTKLTHHQR